MADDRKRVVTATNKVLVYLVIASWAITSILFFSGFRKINPYLLLVVLIALAISVYYIIRKPKPYDIYRIIDEWKTSHYKKERILLDTRDYQVIPITPSLFYVHLPHEGLMGYFDNGKMTGIENNHIYGVLRRNEKSRLVAESIKYLGTEARLKQTAEALNIDLRSLGLE